MTVSKLNKKTNHSNSLTDNEQATSKIVLKLIGLGLVHVVIPYTHLFLGDDDCGIYSKTFQREQKQQLN